MYVHTSIHISVYFVVNDKNFRSLYVFRLAIIQLSVKFLIVARVFHILCTLIENKTSADFLMEW